MSSRGSQSYWVTPTIDQMISCFLAVWWLVGALVLTFSYTYSIVGNGYFACWLGFVSAATLFYVTTLEQYHLDGLRVEQYQSTLIGLLIASIIQLISSTVACTGYLVPDGWVGDCSGDNGFIVAVGCVSVVVCLVLLCTPLSDSLLSQKLVGGGLLIWWAAGVFVATFGTGHGTGMFRKPGNGYFSSWAALVFAAAYALGSAGICIQI